MAFTIKTEKDLVANSYMVKISIPEVTAADRDLLKANGQPSIAVGGTVIGPSDTIALPSRDARLDSGFPVVQAFDGAAHIDPKGLADTWAVDVLARLTSAIGTLRASPDAFSGEASVTI